MYGDDEGTVGPSIDDATLSYVRTVMMKTATNHATTTTAVVSVSSQQQQKTVLDTFRTAFNNWNLSSISDIQLSDKGALDLIFYRHHHLDDTDDDDIITSTIHREMIGYQKHIANLVEQWTDSFSINEETVTFCEVQHVRQMIESSVWDSYIDFCNTNVRISKYPFLSGCELPTIDALRSKLDDIVQIIDTIRNMLIVQVHGKSFTHVEILQAYQVTMTDEMANFDIPDVQSSKLSLDDIRCASQQINTAFGIMSTTAATSSTTTTGTSSPYCSPSADHHQGQAHQNRSDWLYLCAYFHECPSLLFCEMKYNKVPTTTTASGSYRNNITPLLPGYWPNVSDFVRAVMKKKQEIQQTFGSKMLYSRVAQMLSTTLTTEAIINTECQILMNCEPLHITTSDFNNFRIVQLLIDSAQPLRHFVDTCVRYQFHAIANDMTFQALQIAVTDFYATVHHNRDDCLVFFDRLYDIFCPDLTNKVVEEGSKVDIDLSDTGDANSPPAVTPSSSSYVMVLYKMDELTKVLSWLLPFTYISYGPNIWQYVVDDMKWYGTDGYTKFQEEYQKVSRAVSQYSMSNAYSILQDLRSVVRLFSIVGPYKDGSTTIQALLHSFRSNNEIRDCMKAPLMLRHIHEVNGRLHAIQDLFSKFIDFEEHVGGSPPADIPALTIDHPDNTSTANPALQMTSASTTVDCNTMHRWLDEQKLPSTVGDVFLTLGIRTMDDVRMMSELDDNEVNKIIVTLPKFDQMKLVKAMKLQKELFGITTNNTFDTSATTTTTSTTQTPDSKKRKASVTFLSQFLK